VFVVLQASGFVGVVTGIAIAADFESGFGRRLLLAAQHRLGSSPAYALGAAFGTIAIVLLLQLVALAVGMPVDGGVLGLGGLYLLGVRADLGRPRVVPRTGVRAARAARGLGRRRGRQPVHADRRSGTPARRRGARADVHLALPSMPEMEFTTQLL
jgi:hypothetical protein